MSFNYQELLKDPRWQNFSETLKEAAGWQCQICQSIDKPLHAHHLKYVSGRKPWQYHKDLMKILCKDCHQSIHEKKTICCNECKKEVLILNNINLFSNVGLDCKIYVYGCGSCHKEMLCFNENDVKKYQDHCSITSFDLKNYKIRIFVVFPTINKLNEWSLSNIISLHRKEINNCLEKHINSAQKKRKLRK